MWLAAISHKRRRNTASNRRTFFLHIQVVQPIFISLATRRCPIW
jgi:hypothetical protein